MNEQDIFVAAMDHEDPAERQQYLDQACEGDPALRERVENLIRQSDHLGSFLEHPPVEAMTGEADASADSDDVVDPTIVSEKGSTHDDEGDATIPGQNMNQNSQQQDDEIPLGYLQPSTNPESMGRLGHYEILEVIGRGAFGTVLRAFDQKLQRVVAVKVLAPEMAATSPARKRFLREARTSAQIRHENVVSIHAVEDEPTPYLVMEFIPGKTLQQRLDEQGPLSLPDVLRLGKQIADGLAAAHEQGLIHRDIKPGNILLEVGMDERVKITDFGLARTADDASMTQSGVIAGTPLYMAPEQAQGQKLDQRADLFSLGSVLYQMISGRPPFRAPTTVAVLKRVAEDNPRPIQEIIPEVPDWMCALIGHLHAKIPAERYSSAREVSELLARCADDLHAGRVPQIPDPSKATEHSPAGVSEIRPRRSVSLPQSPLVKTVAAVLMMLGVLGITEATGVTQLATTVIRMTTGSGTLVIKSNDPGVKLVINGEEITIRGGGVEELTLRPGEYTVAALKDGKPVKQELVSITHNGRTVVEIGLESDGAFAKPDGSPHNLFGTAGGDVALSFDGQDDYVEVPTVKYAVNSPMTVEAICRIVDLNRSTLVDLGSRETSEFVLRTDAQQWRFERSSGSKWISTRGTQGFKPGPFVHIAGVWDGSRLWLFINGLLQPGSNDNNKSRRRTQLDRLIIGGLGQGIGHQTSPPTEFFGGTVKALRISKIARYTSRFTAPHSFQSDEDTLALYHFDEGSGDVLKDASGNGHHGKIVGATWVRADGTPPTRGGYHWPADAPPPAIAPFDADQAKAHQETWAKYFGVPVEYENSIGMKFRLMPPGEFLMGSTPEEIEAALQGRKDKHWKSCIRSEGPQHKVVLTHPVYVGVTEVTQSQYERLMDANPSAFSAQSKIKEAKETVDGLDTSDFPVELVSWNDAAEFCARLSQQEQLKPYYARSGATVRALKGTGYRLPTEAEWEFFCRAGTTTKFWSGDQNKDLFAVGWSGLNAGGRTHAVGKLKANPFGLLDVNGNVWEWVQDHWNGTFYEAFSDKSAVDPYRPFTDGLQCVFRGGSAYELPSRFRSSHRFAFPRPFRSVFLGFRVVLPVDGKQAVE